MVLLYRGEDALMTDGPNWDDLPANEQAIVNALSELVPAMLGIDPERLLLFYAHLTQGLVDGLASRVIVSRDMGVGDMPDPKVHIAGSVLSNTMADIRDAYDLMFDPDAIAEISSEVNEHLDVLDDLLEHLDSEGIARLLEGLENVGEIVEAVAGISDEEIERLMNGGDSK